jgi:hypothetical protein
MKKQNYAQSRSYFCSPSFGGSNDVSQSGITARTKNAGGLQSAGILVAVDESSRSFATLGLHQNSAKLSVRYSDFDTESE